MAERLTRSRVQAGGAPTQADPVSALLSQLNDAKQAAVVVLQDSNDGLRKLSEASAKLLQASTKLLEMVREDLGQHDDSFGEGGGLPHTTTPRLPAQQAGKAVSLLVEACHLTMRGVLDHAEQENAPTAAAAAAVPVPAPAQPAPARGPAAAAQLWRCGVNVAAALQDASRMMAAPVYYMSYMLTDPSCNALLSIGELGAAIMHRAAAASAAATAAARQRPHPHPHQPSPQRHHNQQQFPGMVKQDPALVDPGATATRPDVMMSEAPGDGVGGGGALVVAAGDRGEQGQGRLTARAGGWFSSPAAAPPSDVSCLLAAHGYSLLLVACEQQPESLLDALPDEPGAAQRLQLVASAALELAAARIQETATCGGDDTATTAPSSTPHTTDVATSPQVLQQQQQQPPPLQQSRADGPGQLAPGGTLASSPSAPASPFSFQFRQLQLVAMRVSELLADDGGYKLMAKRALLPALAEVLLAEPRRFVAWWGCGRDAVLSGLSRSDLLTAPQLRPLAPPASAPGAAAAHQPCSPGNPSPNSGPAASLLQPPPACASTHEAKLQAGAVGMLLKSPAARKHCLPLLLACVRLPGSGTGLAAFGENFRQERFMYGGEGPEREELYVGGRGRGYKRRKVLNPEAHGVIPDDVAAVTAAMTTSLECAVLLCRILSNASLAAPQQDGGANAAAPPSEPGDAAAPPGTGGTAAAAGRAPQRTPSRGRQLGAVGPSDQAIGGQGQGQEQDDPLIGPPTTSGGGGAASAMDVDPQQPPAAVAVAAAAAGRESGSGTRVSKGGGEEEEEEGELCLLPLATALWQILLRRANDSADAATPPAPSAAAAVKRESEGGGDNDGADADADPRLAEAYSQLVRMTRNLAMLLSLLQPVCPNGGQEVREAIRQLGLPVMRWPRMQVRLPVLVVSEDCELLLGLLEDLHQAATEHRRRQEEERRLRDSEAKRAQDRDDRRRKRQEQEQKEAERRLRDKERRQRDRDRIKAMRLLEAADGQAEAAVGEAEGVEGAAAGAFLQGGGGGGDADADGAAAAGHQPRVRLVLRRGAAGPAPGGVGISDPDAAAPGRRRRDSFGDDDGMGAGAEEDVGANGEVPPGMSPEDAADLLGLQVPRQRRSNRAPRPRTPTPTPEVFAQRSAAAVAAVAGHAGPGGVAVGAPPGRRISASSGAGGAMPGGPPGRAVRPPLASREEDRWIGPAPGSATAGVVGVGAGYGGGQLHGVQPHGGLPPGGVLHPVQFEPLRAPPPAPAPSALEPHHGGAGDGFAPGAKRPRTAVVQPGGLSPHALQHQQLSAGSTGMVAGEPMASHGSMRVSGPPPPHLPLSQAAPPQVQAHPYLSHPQHLQQQPHTRPYTQPMQQHPQAQAHPQQQPQPHIMPQRAEQLAGRNAQLSPGAGMPGSYPTAAAGYGGAGGGGGGGGVPTGAFSPGKFAANAANGRMPYGGSRTLDSWHLASGVQDSGGEAGGGAYGSGGVDPARLRGLLQQQVASGAYRQAGPPSGQHMYGDAMYNSGQQQHFDRQ